MDKAQIELIVRTAIAEHKKIDINTVTGASDLREDFDIDSLDMVDIIMDVEDAVGTELIDGNVEKINSLSDLVDYIFNVVTSK